MKKPIILFGELNMKLVLDSESSHILYGRAFLCILDGKGLGLLFLLY